MNIAVIAMLTGWVMHLNGQNCQLPILNQIDNITSQSAEIKWLDFNQTSQSYDIEFGDNDFIETGTPTFSNITQTNFLVVNLESASRYKFYLRTRCDDLNISDWNGPYFFNTNIVNNEACDINLNIDDDNCPNFNVFNIEVNDFPNANIGQFYKMKGISINIAHSWPPDLDLALRSPNGLRCQLSRFNGNSIDHYGDPNKLDCTSTALFTDQACINIENFLPPFIGEFTAEDNLNEIFDNAPINGVWSLEVCDRARGDLGKLRHVEIFFEDNLCDIPSDFHIYDINANEAIIRWNTTNNCERLKFEYKPINASEDEIFTDFIECFEGQFSLTELSPNTTYTLNIFAECSGGLISLPICEEIFQTSCTNASFFEAFDTLLICENNCDTICSTGNIWTSSLLSNNNNWSISNGENLVNTATVDGDKTGFGKFIYLNQNSLDCTSSDTIILSSECLEFIEQDICNVSFYYFVQGIEPGQLVLQMRDIRGEWLNIWEATTLQSTTWIRESVINIPAIEKTQLRFIVPSNVDPTDGFVALDHIKIANAELTEQVTYFIDADNDGYGDPDNSILLCSSLPPPGFSSLNDDCDDSNPFINPGAQELACSLIDEDCNGIVDDSSQEQLDITLVNIDHVTCLGQSDGSIDIDIDGTASNYTYLWSNGSIRQDINNVASGVYYCTITDDQSCMYLAGPYFVDFNQILVYSVKSSMPSECFGLSNGSIKILTSGGAPPYNIVWNNGMAGDSISNLIDGMYQATITDSENCYIETETIEVVSQPGLTIGILQNEKVECFGETTGRLEIGIFDGTPPYEITWNNGAKTESIPNLSSGYFSVTVIDHDGCFASRDNIFVDQYNPLSISRIEENNIECFGKNDGFIDIQVQGGRPPYRYEWSNGLNTPDIFNLSQGSYSVTINDVNNCTLIEENFNIFEFTPLNFQITDVQDQNCAGSEDGAISLNIFGGQEPYQIYWRDTFLLDVTDPTIDGLNAGSYQITIVDENACKTLTENIVIGNDNAPLTVQVFQNDQNLCSTDSIASIIATVQNGTIPIDYNWSIGQKNNDGNFSDTIINLGSGIYDVTVTDVNGCIGTSQSVIIPDIPDFKISEVIIENNDCSNLQEGSIELLTEGGQSPITYFWSNGDTTGIINNLPNEIYYCTIIDASGCQITSDSFRVESPSTLDLVYDLEPSGLNGFLSFEWFITGGIPPYQFMIDSLQFNTSLGVIEMSEGEYPASIIDQNGCTLDTLINIMSTSINQSHISQHVFSVFPNPTNDQLNIKSESKTISRIKILNLSGQTIYDELQDQTKITIDIQNQDSKGIHILNIYTVEGLADCQLVVFL